MPREEEGHLPVVVGQGGLFPVVVGQGGLPSVAVGQEDLPAVVGQTIPETPTGDYDVFVLGFFGGHKMTAELPVNPMFLKLGACSDRHSPGKSAAV